MFQMAVDTIVGIVVVNNTLQEKQTLVLVTLLLY